MISYRAIRPSLPNTEFVDCYWLLQGTATPEDIQRIVPDGRPELIIHLGDSFAHQRGAIWEPQPECFFVGQISGPMLLRPTGRTNTFGIRFHPHGASRLFRLPLEELSGRSVPLLDLMPALDRELSAVRDLPHHFPAAQTCGSGAAAALRAECQEGPHRRGGPVGDHSLGRSS